MKKLSVKEVASIFNKVIMKLKDEGNDTMVFENDLYRVIPTEEWNLFEGFSIDNCSLFDDIDNLKELANNPRRVCTYVDLDRLASVLRELSSMNNPI